MENKYLNKMVIKPDYVVFYNEKTKNYFGVVKSENMYDTDSMRPCIIGYAASAKHPNEPLIIRIDICDAITHYYQNHTDIYVFTVGRYGTLCKYTKPHDLFIYKNRMHAVWAGKEMALQDEVENVKEKYTNTGDILNVFMDKVNDFEEYAKNVNLEVTKEDALNYLKDFADKAKSAYKTYKTGRQLAELVKDGVDKATKLSKEFVDSVMEGFKQNDDVEQPTQEVKSSIHENTNSTFVKYFDKVCVVLKHKINNYGGIEVHKYYIQIDDKPSTQLVHKQYEDICEIFANNGTLDDIKKVYAKPEKTNPIQFCEFRKKDIQKEELKTKKTRQKFQVGDKVYNKDRGYGVIIDVKTIKTNDGKKRKMYTVDFSNNEYYQGLYNALSYELDKA